MSANVNNDKKTNSMYFLIKDDELLNKYSTIWDKISADAKIELTDKPIYNFLRLKQTFYDDKAMKKIKKQLDSSCTCLAVISLNSIFELYESYYPLVFLKEHKYIEKK